MLTPKSYFKKEKHVLKMYQIIRKEIFGETQTADPKNHIIFE